MDSANGFLLTGKTRVGSTYELAASWAAPFFAFVDNTHEPNDKPMLYHAETRADAERFARSCSSGKPIILNAQFEVIN